nr:MAG TPA: hypothetical protein [Caudoviricetes sp.]
MKNSFFMFLSLNILYCLYMIVLLRILYLM